MNTIEKKIQPIIDDSKFILQSLRISISKMDSSHFNYNVLDFIDYILRSAITKNINSVEWINYLNTVLIDSRLISSALEGELTINECAYLGEYLNSIYKACQYFEYLNVELIEKIRIQKSSTSEIDRLRTEVNQLPELRKELTRYQNTEQNKKAQTIYESANKKHGDKETVYRRWFVGVLIFSILITLGYDPNFTILANLENLWSSLTSTVPTHNQNAYLDSLKISVPVLHDYSLLKFIFFKIAILFVGITLSTYFLKLSNYYRSLKDQAHQTKLELEAFPDYVAGLDHAVTNRLREELALKYFGQDLDRSVNDKLGNLVQDQISVGTELVKASAELIKVKDSLPSKKD